MTLVYVETHHFYYSDLEHGMNKAMKILVRVMVIADLLFGRIARGLLLKNHPVVSRTTICLNAQRKENKAMEFLRKVGRVGINQDFTNAIGVDEGPSGKAKGVSVVFSCEVDNPLRHDVRTGWKKPK